MNEIHIGSWILHERTQQLVGKSGSHLLDTKCFSVLQQLTQAAPDFVRRETLLNNTWKSVVVTDNSLHQVIARLRKCFSDSPRAPSYLETLPRRGYRIVAPVSYSKSQHRSHHIGLTVYPIRNLGTNTCQRISNAIMVKIKLAFSKVAGISVLPNAIGVGDSTGLSMHQVTHALEGYCQCADSTIDLVFHVIDLESGSLIDGWQCTFQRADQNLISIQDRVAQEACEHFVSSLLPEEERVA